MARCVIIDSESSETFVSKKLVAALNLKVEPHPNAYKIGWAKKGGEAQVSEICMVPLSIGSGYKDQIVCDMLDMDVTSYWGDLGNLTLELCMKGERIHGEESGITSIE